ncbi:MAG: glycosyltransferase family 4 protein [Deltaproteobacteria bacterium]|nr:glycosyltransferase family 4 protein [Deltaproteobacteria bacterium]
MPTQSSTHPRALLVSKPIAPPWNDSSKNLVKDLAHAGERYRYTLLGIKDSTWTPRPPVDIESIFSRGSRFSPALRQNARTFRRILRDDGTALTHFFFAPNPKAAFAARVALRLRPRRSVQTVCSIPASFEHADRLLFAEKVIVLSHATRTRFIAAGIAEDRLVHIPPGIVLPPLPSAPERRATRRRLGIPEKARVVIFPGDYQFSRAAQTFARAISRLRDPNFFFVFACRIKQPASRQIEARIDADLRTAGIRHQTLMLNDVPNMIDLLGTCDACALPAESLYAKMDLPLVLIEALALNLPIIVADVAPLTEFLDQTSGIGGASPPGDAAALAASIQKELERGRRSASRRVAEERYEISSVARRVEALYDELLARAP